MNKTVFINMPMRDDLIPLRYKADGNSAIDYDGEVLFPANAVLAKTLAKGDKVKVILLVVNDIAGNSAVNAGLFQRELNAINSKIGAEIEYISVAVPFEETGDIHESLFLGLAHKLEANSTLIGDITFGPKSLPIIMFSVMNFAEKFFGCEVSNIVYGRVDFVDDGSGTKKVANPVLCDMAPLYYLNSISNVMEYKSADEALKALDKLLAD